MLTIGELNRLAKDTGCYMHDDCLTCPLPKCIYDTSRICIRTTQRRGIIRQMAESMNTREVAEQLGISTRTVQRALKE